MGLCTYSFAVGAFNGQVTLEIVLFGIVIAGRSMPSAANFWTTAREGLDDTEEIRIHPRLSWGSYLEIIKANAATLKLIVSPIPESIL